MFKSSYALGVRAPGKNARVGPEFASFRLYRRHDKTVTIEGAVRDRG